MRFPELPGYQYEGLLEEDSFGWTFVASHESGERRSIRIFKSQATNDRFLYPYFKALSDDQGGFPGIDPIHHYALQDARGLTACAGPFHGWKEGSEWRAGSLWELAGRLPRRQVVEVLRDLATALESLHRAHLFHGGLRPSAIRFVTDPHGATRVVLSGFGGVFMGGLQYLEAGEFLYYAAPEQLATGDPREGRGQAWDVYSFGVVAFQLLNGRLPRLDRLRRHEAENPSWFEASPAITFGEISEVTEYFLEQLREERAVEWPASARDPREAKLRQLVESCLTFEVKDRPADFVELGAAVREAVAELLAGEGRAARSGSKTGAKTGSKTSPGSAAKAGGDRALPTTSAPASEVASAPSGIFDEIDRPHTNPETWARSAAPSRSGKGGNSALRWQLAALASMVLCLALTFVALYNYVEVRQAKKLAETDLLRERQTKVDQQAAAYSRMQAERAKNTELISELNAVEDSKNNLLGQAKLARQLLRETQANGDRFFRLVLDNRDSDVPGFREGRAAALEEGVKHYERLVETYGDAPDFIVSTANAFFYLGRIYGETGEFGKSLAAFGEAERRYSALLENDDSAKVDFIKNIAFSKHELGNLAFRDGQHAVARHYFTESSRFWSEARSADSASAAEASLNIHGNSLAIVECEIAMDRLDAALDAASSVGISLTAMQKADPGNARLVGTLAKSFSLVGRVLETRRQPDLAREAYQQSGDLYAEAVRLDASVDAYQLGLGNSLARVGLLSNDVDKLEGAAEVLGRVAAANPFESVYLKTLADIYGVLAVGQRDGGKVKNAVALEEKAIAILKPIVEGNKEVGDDVKFSYAQRLAHLADLLGDSGKFDESRVPLKEAVALLEDITDGEGASAEYRRTLARTLGMAGFAFLKTGDKGEAREQFELAKTEWQTYMAAHPDDPSAAQAVKWTAEQLEELR